MTTRMVLLMLVVMVLNRGDCTVEYVLLNHGLGEYTIMEDGGLLDGYRPLGYVSAGEGDKGWKEAKDLGYEYTRFPYKLESLIMLCTMLFGMLLWYWTACRKKGNTYQTSR